MIQASPYGFEQENHFLSPISSHIFAMEEYDFETFECITLDIETNLNNDVNGETVVINDIFPKVKPGIKESILGARLLALLEEQNKNVD